MNFQQAFFILKDAIEGLIAELGIVVMPNRHSVDIPRKVKTGLLSSVLKDAGVTVEEFIDAL